VKTILLLLAAASLTAAPEVASRGGASAAAQVVARKVGGPVYRLGDRDVVIPAPEGFEEASSRVEAVRRSFEATEEPNLEMLAVHVPAEELKRLEGGGTLEMTFYTKVSVARMLKAADYSPSDFRHLISTLEANMAEVYSFDDREMAALMRSQSRSVSELLERESKVDLSKPVNLGVFARTQNAHATALLVKVKIESGDLKLERLLVCGLALVRVRQRLVFVNTYKALQSAADVDALKKFTLSWLARIQQANEAR
jgi:hypothetical protein